MKKIGIYYILVGPWADIVNYVKKNDFRMSLELKEIFKRMQ